MDTNSKESNNLLLLGLELLKNINKSSKVPYAVVKPRVQTTPGELASNTESLKSPLMSGNERKRKHSNEVSELDRKEKR